MKKIISILSLVCILALPLSSCGKTVLKNPGRQENVPIKGTSVGDLSSTEYRLVAENDKMAFYINEGTTDVKVKVKSTGYEWSTVDAAGINKPGNIFTLTYHLPSGTVDPMTTETESIEKGQFRISDIENGVKVEYALGLVNFTPRYPLAISKKRMEIMKEKLEAVNPMDAVTMESYYMLVDFDSEEMKSQPEDMLSKYKLDYPLAVKEPWYYPAAAFSDDDKIDLNRIFEQIDYSEADYKTDSEGVKQGNTERPEFSLNMYYTLDNGSLVVRIPEEEIYHSDDFVIETIKLHPGLASFANGTNGYFLLPDGSGSIMNFNNKKEDLYTDPVYVPIYGVDKSVGIKQQTGTTNQAIFPVYGVSLNDGKNKNGLFTIIEEGDAFAGVEAHSSSGDNANTIWPEFRINEKTTVKEAGTSDKENKYHSVYQKQRYKGDIRLRYNFLTGEDSEYSGMAKFYEKYLFGDSKASSNAKPYSATVETVGQINQKKNFLGITYNSDFALTTYNQAAEMAADLKNSGIANLNFKYSGWFGNGYEHSYTDKVRLAKLLGSEEQFKKMISEMALQNVNFYPDADVQYAYTEAGNPSSKDIASIVNLSHGLFSGYDPVTFLQTNSLMKYNLISSAVNRNIKGYTDYLKTNQISNVSFRNVGGDISANYRESETYLERQGTMNNLVDQMASVKEQGFKIMGTGGNAPFVKYLDVINNMPVESSGIEKTDYSVPFTAMVLSGHIEYTYKPINLSNGESNDLLKLIESGAGANYVLTSSRPKSWADTSFEHLYSTTYDEVKGSVISSYNMLANAQKDTYGCRILKHARLADGVFKTTYDNGSYVVVNYSDKDYKNGQMTVKASGYTTGKESVAK